MTGFFLRAALAALGLWFASRVVNGLVIDDAGTLLFAAVLLGVVNAVVRPLAMILTLPLTILTLGLFLLVVNAAMLALVAWLLPGFHLGGFRAAFYGALLVGLAGWIGTRFVRR